VLARLDDLVRSEVSGEFSLACVLCYSDEGAWKAQRSQGRDHAEAKGSRPQHDYSLPAGYLRGKRRVDRTSGRLDHDGCLVGEVVGDRVELALVRNQPR